MNVWFPAVRAGTGADMFTERLADELRKRGLRAEITWLPHRAEYAPWAVPVPKPPVWANVAHVNTWLHPRFLPKHLPIVATLHHSIHHPGLAPYKGSLRSAYHQHLIIPIERRTLRRANCVVAVSRFAADTARQTLLDRPMQVIYNGVDTEQFSPPAQRTTHQPFQLLYVGKWASLKGIDLLGPIMRELGDGFELRYTGGAAAARGQANLPANMRDLGRLQGADAVIAAMQDADAFLFPSRSEGFPLVVIEAMACGLPVLTTRGSSLAEAVTHDLTGILCPQDDVKAFANAARQLAQDLNKRERMSAASRASVMSDFSTERMVEKYIDVYTRAVSLSAA